MINTEIELYFCMIKKHTYIQLFVSSQYKIQKKLKIKLRNIVNCDKEIGQNFKN